MARLWARTTTYDSVEVGDELPILVKWETSETIERFAGLVGVGDKAGTTHGDPPGKDHGMDSPGADGVDLGEARQAPSQALVSYVTELLEKGFPLSRITASGSSLSLQLMAPVNAEDTISLSGEVVAKRQQGGFNLVECSVRIDNQDNQVVAQATALVSL